MIDMELLSVIRRWALRDQLSIREIARRTGLSRNTIRKYLRSDAVEVKFKVPERTSKLDAFAGKLSDWLKTEARKPRKQKRTLKQLHGDLVALGFTGSYNRVAACARDWKAERNREQHKAVRPHVCPVGVPARRSVPVRLERGLGAHRRRADQAASRAVQAVAQPRLLRARLSAANPRDAV
ncbi:transcriptional regulator with XRE-family HTH domain [Rhodoblastus acidophilus]|nr:transcriptional regulator with XRE-family HTH domain [Rhodoblastus acidophilus]MCW2332676.1 transcriptional regulator with XRE-family HTH domain [Rhodoblastus acidophilus]